MRLSLSRTDGGGFLRLARLVTTPAHGGRSVMSGGFPCMLVRSSGGGFAASALRVPVERALGLEDCRVVPALPVEAVREVLRVARAAVSGGETGIWLVLHANGATEAMGTFDFGGMLSEFSHHGQEAVVTASDRPEADAALAWFEDFHAPAAMAG